MKIFLIAIALSFSFLTTTAQAKITNTQIKQVKQVIKALNFGASELALCQQAAKEIAKRGLNKG